MYRSLVRKLHPDFKKQDDHHLDDLWNRVQDLQVELAILRGQCQAEKRIFLRWSTPIKKKVYEEPKKWQMELF